MDAHTLRLVPKLETQRTVGINHTRRGDQFGLWLKKNFDINKKNNPVDQVRRDSRGNMYLQLTNSTWERIGKSLMEEDTELEADLGNLGTWGVSIITPSLVVDCSSFVVSNIHLELTMEEVVNQMVKDNFETRQMPEADLKAQLVRAERLKRRVQSSSEAPAN